MSTEQELEVIPNKYEEFVASARDFSSENPRFMKVSNPVLLRFAEAVVMKEIEPKSQVWNLREELGPDVTANAHYDVMMNARMMRFGIDRKATGSNEDVIQTKVRGSIVIFKILKSRYHIVFLFRTIF
jgi:hypothetical protein